MYIIMWFSRVECPSSGRYLNSLSHTEKFQLIQDIAEMLNMPPDETSLHRLRKAAEVNERLQKRYKKIKKTVDNEVKCCICDMEETQDLNYEYVPNKRGE